MVRSGEQSIAAISTVDSVVPQTVCGLGNIQTAPSDSPCSFEVRSSSIEQVGLTRNPVLQALPFVATENFYARQDSGRPNEFSARSGQPSRNSNISNTSLSSDSDDELSQSNLARHASHAALQRHLYSNPDHLPSNVNPEDMA